jgi:hypothetical protein
MADLEEHAFKRDKRFVVRLVLAILVASLGGLFVCGGLTSRGTTGCAADALVTEGAPAGSSNGPK